MFFTLPFKRSIAKTSHDQSQQKRRTSPRHSILCLIRRAISSEWPALRASVFYYTRFGGGVKGVFVEGEKTSDFFVGETVLSYAYKFTIPVLDGMVDFHLFSYLIDILLS